MMFNDAINILSLKFNDTDGSWYLRHPSQPNLLFYGSKKQIYAKAMKDKKAKKIFPVNLGLDMLVSKDWEIIKAKFDKHDYLIEVTVLDINT